MFSIRSFFRVMLGISVMCVILARRTDAECDLSALLQTLENPAPAGSDYFGSAAGISGNLAVVGAPNDDPGGLVDAGSAYVFNAATGAQLTTLNKPAPAAGDRFGASVAISGNLVVVGADGDDPGGINNAGRAYVFNATTGALVATLNNPNPAESDNFGSCVGISGNLAVVGARGDDPGGVIDAGSAYVFNATTGALIATLNNPAPVANDYFGAAAISGNLAVVGAQSAAYVFNATTGALVMNLNIPPAGPSGGDEYTLDFFAGRVAIDGNLIAVGADYTVFVYRAQWPAGMVHLFNATTGALVRSLQEPIPGRYDYFGNCLGVSGNLVVAGCGGRGLGYVFDAITGALVATLNDPNPTEEGYFGYLGAAISGNLVLMGAAVGVSGGISYSGKAYVFGCPPPPCDIMPINAAHEAKIRGAGIPKILRPNQTVHVSFVVTNTGNIPWTAECGFRLGKVNGAADPFGPDRIDLPPGVTIAPGQSWTFETDFTAPAAPGIYRTQWRMLQEGNVWFGISLQRKIRVTSP